MVEYWNVDLTKEVAHLLTSLSRKIFSIDQFSARLFTHYSITPVFQYSNCERSELSSLIESLQKKRAGGEWEENLQTK